jgi:hypothetical protein
MILKFLKGSQPALMFVIPLVGVLIWLPSFLEPLTLPADPYPMPLYDLLDGLINTHPLVSCSASLLFALITAFLLARINTRFILIPSRTYLPCAIFLLITGVYPQLRYFHPSVPAALFILLATERMFNAYKQEGLSYAFFESALLISVASLFYAWASLYLLLVWLGLYYLRAFQGREWIMSVAGFLMPYAILVAVYYVADRNLQDLWTTITSNFHAEHQTRFIIFPYYIFLGYLLLVIILASLKMRNMYDGLKVLVRQFSKVFFWLFLLSVIFFLIFFTGSPGLIMIAGISAAYLLSFYLFALRSRIIGEVIFILFIVAFAAVQVLI